MSQSSSNLLSSNPDQNPCLLLLNPSGQIQVGLPTEPESGETLPEIVLRAEGNLRAGRGTSQDLMSLLDPYCEAARSTFRHYMYRSDYGTLPLVDHQTNLIHDHDFFVQRVVALTNTLLFLDALFWSLYLAAIYYRDVTNGAWQPLHYMFVTPIVADVIGFIALTQRHSTLLSIYCKFAAVSSLIFPFFINPLLFFRVGLPFLAYQVYGLLQTTAEEKIQLGYERERFTGLPAFTIAISPSSEQYAVGRIY